MTNTIRQDPPDDDSVRKYLSNMSRLYQLTGLRPTDEDNLSTTCAYLEWHLLVGLIVESAKIANVPDADRLMNLINPEIKVKGGVPSMICTALLANEEVLGALIHKAIVDNNTMLSRFGVHLDEEKTTSAMRSVVKFLARNPEGIEVKLLDSTIRSGVFVIPATSDEGDKARTQAFQILSEEIIGDMFKQRLVGINPSSTEGEEVMLEIAYWMAGFSGTCTFAVKSSLSNPDLMKKLIETSMKVLMREELVIEPPLFDVLRGTLEDFLLNNRMLMIQVGMKSWENPMLNQYATSNLGKFDKDTLVSTMESLLIFMKANSGFRTA